MYFSSSTGLADSGKSFLITGRLNWHYVLIAHFDVIHSFLTTHVQRWCYVVGFNLLKLIFAYSQHMFWIGASFRPLCIADLITILVN